MSRSILPRLRLSKTLYEGLGAAVLIWVEGTGLTSTSTSASANNSRANSNQLQAPEHAMW